MRITRTIFYFMIIILGFLQSVCAEKKTVVLDNFYNNEFDEITGKPFHYLWEDKNMSGFSQLGDLFQKEGATLFTLKEKPNRINLKDANIYIIVDPDTDLESAHPNYMDKKAAIDISDWVKNGGIILILANDYKSCNLETLNILTSMFNIKFNNTLLHPEKSKSGISRDFDSCASKYLPNHPLFCGVSKIFIKEIASITCEKPAKPVLEENGQVLMAECSFGKGYVLAIGDPWLYNEYIDHALLPKNFDNMKAAENLVNLLLSYTKGNK